MAQTIPTLTATLRSETGSRPARRSRNTGMTPAVLYGHKQDNLNLSVTSEEVLRLLAHNTQLVELSLDGKPERALIKDVQYNYAGDVLLHVDFARVALDEKVTVTVALSFHGTPIGTTHGGVVEYHVTEVEIECLPMAIPESIRVDVDGLELNATLHARDIVLPEGVKLLEDPEEIIVGVHVAKLAEAPAPAEGEEVAEPEVIGEKKHEEEEEGKEGKK